MIPSEPVAQPYILEYVHLHQYHRSRGDRGGGVDGVVHGRRHH